MEYLVYIVLGIVAVVAIWYITTYNSFKKLVIETEESSSGIDVALAKRYDLITNLVAVVKGYTKHEKETLEKIVSLRSSLKNNRNQANTEMNGIMSQILLLVEAYPEIKANENYLHLQKSLVDVEEHLQAARRLYNRRVAELNVKIHQFPTNYVAKSMNVTQKEFFSAEEDQRSSVKVEIE